MHLEWYGKDPAGTHQAIMTRTPRMKRILNQQWSAFSRSLLEGEAGNPVRLSAAGPQKQGGKGVEESRKMKGRR
jgi:hypothetical protein